MSRGWQSRNFIRDVGLMVIDEIHLLGEDRGPVLEVIVSRTNFISDRTGRKLRIVGLSTAMANARDLATWLGIGEVSLLCWFCVFLCGKNVVYIKLFLFQDGTLQLQTICSASSTRSPHIGLPR